MTPSFVANLKIKIFSRRLVATPKEEFSGKNSTTAFLSFFVCFKTHLSQGTIFEFQLIMCVHISL
jgi:hypothetical protein